MFVEPETERDDEPSNRSWVFNWITPFHLLYIPLAIMIGWAFQMDSQLFSPPWLTWVFYLWTTVTFTIVVVSYRYGSWELIRGIFKILLVICIAIGLFVMIILLMTTIGSLPEETSMEVIPPMLVLIFLIPPVLSIAAYNP